MRHLHRYSSLSSVGDVFVDFPSSLCCSGLAKVERSAQKQAKANGDNVWNEKWYVWYTRINTLQCIDKRKTHPFSELLILHKRSKLDFLRIYFRWRVRRALGFLKWCLLRKRSNFANCRQFKHYKPRMHDSWPHESGELFSFALNLFSLGVCLIAGGRSTTREVGRRREHTSLASQPITHGGRSGESNTTVMEQY